MENYNCYICNEIISDNIVHVCKLCAICEKVSKYKCSNCITHYCSKECQLKDYPHHKILCYYLPKEYINNKINNGLCCKIEIHDIIAGGNTFVNIYKYGDVYKIDYLDDIHDKILNIIDKIKFIPNIFVHVYAIKRIFYLSIDKYYYTQPSLYTSQDQKLIVNNKENFYNFKHLFYPNYNDVEKLKIRICEYCRKMSTDGTYRKCSQCYFYYCNEQCQLSDWNSHKNMCTKINSLTNKNTIIKNINHVNNTLYPNFLQQGEWNLINQKSCKCCNAEIADKYLINMFSIFKKDVYENIFIRTSIKNGKKNMNGLFSCKHLVSILNNIFNNIEDILNVDLYHIFISLELLKNYIINNKKFYLLITIKEDGNIAIYIIDDSHPDLD